MESFGDHLSVNKNEVNDEIKLLRKRLAEHELLHSKIKSEFDALKQISDESNAKAFMYYKLLEEERHERKRIETEALDMLKNVKNKYEKSVINETINKLKADYEKQIEDLKNDNNLKSIQIKGEIEISPQKEVKEDDWNSNELQNNDKNNDNDWGQTRDKSDNKESFDALKLDYEKRIEEKVLEYEQILNDLRTEFDSKIAEYEKEIEELKKDDYLKSNQIKNENEDQWDWNEEEVNNEDDWGQTQDKGENEESVNAFKLEEKVRECDQRLNDMRNECDLKVAKMKSDYEKRIEEIESELKETKTQIDFLTNEAKCDVKENKVLVNKENEKLKEQMIKYKEDYTIAKLDLRSTKKDLEKSEEQVKYLREHLRDLKKQLKESQESFDKEKEINKTKDQVIEGLKSDIKSLENNTKVKDNEYQLINALKDEKMKTLETESKALKELQNEGSKWRGKYDELNKTNEQLLQRIQVLETKNSGLEMQLNSKTNECEQKDVSIKKLKNTNKILQEQCTQIEKQAEQFKNRYEGLGEQKQKLLVDKSDTVSEIQRLNKELENIRNKLKAELKDKEESYNKLESEQAQYEKQFEAEKQKLLALKQEYEKECQKSREYEERLSVQERNLYSSDETINNLDAKVNYLEQHLIAIKEEAAHHITMIANLKDSNQRLTNAFEESMRNVESLQERIDSLYNELEAKEEELHHEKVTNQETIGQQLKLIDFLQNKIESIEKQKKPLFSITPTKKIVNTSRLCPIEFKDLDRALAEEKTKNRRLNEELCKIKSEANYYKTEVLQLKKSIKTDQLNSENQTLEKQFDLFNDHNNIVNEIPVQNQTQTQFDNHSESFQRMHHNIPHRFVEVINKLKSRCVSCAESIHFGRKAMKCSECSATSHPKCVQMLSNNCGLPVELMQHMFHSSHDVNDNYFDDIENGEEQDVVEVQVLEPSAPESDSPVNYDHSSDSSATTDNNESDSGAFMSQAMETPANSDIREIEAICDEYKEEGFSFTDSMVEALEKEQTFK